MRSGVLLSAEVEDLQVEFAVDANENHTIEEPAEFPIHILAGFDPALIRRAQVTVITRSRTADPQFRSPGLPAAGNRVAGLPDQFRRRSFTAMTVPRNLEI